RAAIALEARGITPLVAPPLPYGVTDFAAGFAGAVSVPAEVLTALLAAGAEAFLRDGFKHVCLINHHLEPGQLAAIEAARAQIAERHGAHAISAPQVISRRWGRALGAEFRSGACHAGAYEGSLVLAAAPALVDRAAAAALPALDVSLSAAIADAAAGFRAIGMTRAYTGQPAEASPEEGERLYAALTEMVTTEVREHLEKRP
ncbi:MAG: creatininase family protein, partial [Myxococcales bacterium]|nr:creatininase family protein [Myxococcales bacterium]